MSSINITKPERLMNLRHISSATGHEYHACYRAAEKNLMPPPPFYAGTRPLWREAQLPEIRKALQPVR